MQQLTEVSLRDGLLRFSHAELRLGHTMQTIEQGEQGVNLTVRGEDGEDYCVRCGYAVAADGARSEIRKLLGIGYEGMTHAAKWVVVEAANDRLDAPYTALHADPERPFVCIHMPYQYRRWEFMLHEGENEERMCEEPRIHSMIRKHIGAAVDALEIVSYPRLYSQFAGGIQLCQRPRHAVW
jgi:3-(3-hydroxy-phenyl)propionate hydroxylase